MRLLLDTHALLWWVLGNPRLSEGAKTALAAPGNIVCVSAVTGHEIATKHRLGKLDVPIQLAEALDQVVAANGWSSMPLTMAHAQLAGRLSGSHKDPFDRMLAAQSIVEDIPIVTNDPAIASLGATLIL